MWGKEGVRAARFFQDFFFLFRNVTLWWCDPPLSSVSLRAQADAATERVMTVGWTAFSELSRLGEKMTSSVNQFVTTHAAPVRVLPVRAALQSGFSAKLFG